MVSEDCPAGRKWDSLVRTCVPRPEPETSTELPPMGQLRSTAPTAPAHSVMLLSPALWISVVVVTLGSILALVLWFIIYKRQTRHSSTSEDAGLQQEPLQKTEPPSERNGHAEKLQRAAWASSPCPHLYHEAQTRTEWEGLYRLQRPRKACWDRGGQRVAYMQHKGTHRIPLPATELGGTVLVTTKTV